MAEKKQQYLGALALVVKDYDEAKAWYADVLGFQVVEDLDQGEGKRWLVVAPPHSSSATHHHTRLVLAKAVTEEEKARVGNQTGGRVFLFLHTDDFGRDHAAMLARGVRFREAPRTEVYGTVAVFEDLYGNLWDLLEPAAAPQ